ncbi:hypothetical protein ACHAWT_003112 [Skeletonema menzelii]
MELDPILAMEDSGLLPVVAAPQAAAPENAANKNINNNPIAGAVSSSSLPLDEDPVTSLLGSGSTAAAGATAQEKPSAAVPPSTPTRSPPSAEANTSNNNEDLSNTLSNLLLSNTIPQSTISTLQQILRENATLKEKNSKLKSLLGRSAKAQRDAKQDLEQLKKRYEEINREKERLKHRVEVLANRPTHMDLLADFETNFDRALLAIGTTTKEQKKNSQTGGEDAAERRGSLEEEEDEDIITAAAAEAAATSLYEEMNRSTLNTSMYNSSSSSNTSNHNRRQSSANNSSLLLSELTEAKSRITHLESLNTSLQTRCTHLEHTHNALFNEHTHTKNTVTNLQLELRMSKMETEHAQRTLREKEAMVSEMQLEINLVTASAVEANKRAAEGYEVAQSVKMDKEYVDGLEAKVVALQDWALASTESKQLMSERCRGLEGRVKELTSMVELLQKKRHGQGNSGEGGGGGDDDGEGMICLEDGTTIDDLIPLKKVGSSASSLASIGGGGGERVLWTKSSSLVVGAGNLGTAFIELGSVQIESYETVTLRWKFDLTRDEEDIYFSILKGICEEKRKQRSADACFRNRHVKGGGGGDVSGAFAVQNACTLVWSNEMSWFRPKTIKWTVEAVAIEWSD